MSDSISMARAFLMKYPSNGKVIEKWEAATGCPFEWGNLSKANMSRFTSYLCDNMARSSSRQYCAKIKAVIEIYSDEVDLPKDWRRFLTVSDDESQQTYLTEVEIQRIIDYVPDTITEATVQQQFILGCLTGARHSDYSRFTESNVSQHGTLVYVSQKTHIKVEIPFSSVAKDILFAKGNDYSGAYKRTVSDKTFNGTIRNICRLCDIDNKIQLYRNGKFWSGPKYEAVSSHTSRRSFCTNLYLRSRDLYLVSKLAGHSSTQMTERYVCCNMEALTEAAMSYFEQFK